MARQGCLFALQSLRLAELSSGPGSAGASTLQGHRLAELFCGEASSGRSHPI